MIRMYFRFETYKNGSLGTIERLNKKSISILLDDKRLIQVTPDGSGCYPITYGWAITVHKSQGLTFDHINLARGFFAEAQLYVAVSRCRTLKGMRKLKNSTYEGCDHHSPFIISTP